MNRNRLWITIATMLVLAVMAYGAVSWVFSSLIIGAETQTLADAAAGGDTPAEYGLPEPEVVSIDTGDIALSGWLFENPREGDCGLMFLHGFRGTRYHVLNWARLFWERGCDVLAYDHRGHGNSTPAFHTYGFYEKQDALGALNWFAGRTWLEQPKIGVFGVSYGAATALQMASMTPDIAFVGADSAYSELDEIVSYQARQLFPRLAPLVLPGALRVAELRADFDVAAVAPERSMAEIEVPVLLVHSLSDEYTLPSHSQDIYANSDPDRTVLELTDWGAPHGRSIITDPLAYESLISYFLAEFVPDYGLPPTP